MLFAYNLSRNYQTQPRQFQGFRLHAIGYSREKWSWVDTTFDSLNYSIILSGQGHYYCGDYETPVSAPCVITQQPGCPVRYGPQRGTTWEELYLILPPELEPWLIQSGRLGPQPHYWPIRNKPAVLQATRQFLNAVEADDGQPGSADRIDHVAESLIRESLLPGSIQTDRGLEAVSKLAELMRSAPGASRNVEEYALDYGLSLSTFLRRWRELFPCPPGQYLLNQRISEACRLLAETERPVSEISLNMGFDDPAYFSRLFHRRIGMAPSAYRTIHHATAV